jgi:hypothetical protein
MGRATTRCLLVCLPADLVIVLTRAAVRRPRLTPAICWLSVVPCVRLQVTLDDLKEVVAGFHRSLGEAATWVDERKPAMVHALGKAIRDVVDRLQVGVWGM